MRFSISAGKRVGKNSLFLTNASSSSKRHTFRKAERLSGRKRISKLFSGGQRLHSGPLTLIWVDLRDSDVPAKVLFSVPKARFKRAVDRNLLKRRMRESFRLRNRKVGGEWRKMALAFVYRGKTMSDFETIKASLGELLKQLESVFAGS